MGAERTSEPMWPAFWLRGQQAGPSVWDGAARAAGSDVSWFLPVRLRTGRALFRWDTPGAGVMPMPGSWTRVPLLDPSSDGDTYGWADIEVLVEHTGYALDNRTVVVDLETVYADGPTWRWLFRRWRAPRYRADGDLPALLCAAGWVLVDDE